MSIISIITRGTLCTEHADRLLMTWKNACAYVGYPAKDDEDFVYPPDRVVLACGCVAAMDERLTEEPS